MISYFSGLIICLSCTLICFGVFNETGGFERFIFCIVICLLYRISEKLLLTKLLSL